MTIRFGFVGTGYINKIHAKAVRKLPDAELTAVLNHRLESMNGFAKVFNIPNQYTGLEDLLKNKLIDALIISTPNALHAPQTISALRAGIHVLVEKPMAMNSREAAVMLKMSEQSGAILMVGHCWRFDEEVLWLKRQVETEALGDIIRTKGYGVHANWGPSGWFTQANLAGGGALADMGIHAVDTARFLIGDPFPISVYARIGTHYGEYDVDDTGLVIVNWDNGITSYIESGWWQPHKAGPEAATQIYGKKGFGEIYPTHLVLPDKDKNQTREVESGFPHPRPEHCSQSMYDAQIAYFASCIRNSAIPTPGGLEGWINMQIIDAAYKSAGTGQVVKVSEL